MTNNLQDGNKDFNSASHPAHHCLYAAMTTRQLQEVLAACFQVWKDEIYFPSFLQKGVLFVCDAEGQFIDGVSAGLFKGETFQKLGLYGRENWSLAHKGNNAIGLAIRDKTRHSMSSIEHETDIIKRYHSHAIPIFCGSNDLLAVIGCLTRRKVNGQDIYGFLDQIAIAFNALLELQNVRKKHQQWTTERTKIEKESKKQDFLLQISKKLHSKFDVDSVLSEVMANIKELYPSIEIDLYLSQDSHSTSLPVKPLIFHRTENNICTRAFMEGHIIVEDPPLDEQVKLSIAAPLCGKQGVYGVLHFLSKEGGVIDETDLKFITMIAESAGSAFENAKLYEQSNFLIDELRLVNEITKRLNQSLKLNEICRFAANELIKIFNADYGCILQNDDQQQVMIVQSSNIPELNNETFSVDYGFSGIVISSKEPIIISDYWANPNIQSKIMDVTNARSLIAAPIMVGSKVMGVILVVHSKPHYFSYDNYKLLQVLSGHIGLAMTNASLHAEVRRMVITDNLTGLYARHYLDEQINIMQKQDFCGSLIVADIDHFKQINDTYGHQVGDEILIQVCRIIQSSIRDTDIAARWGGEELAIYLPQSGIDQTIPVAERIRRRVSEETNPKVTVSCGVAEWSWDDEKISVESLFYKSDMSLYKAKHEGRNQIRVSE